MINILYYEHWTDKRKYFYVWNAYKKTSAFSLSKFHQAIKIRARNRLIDRKSYKDWWWVNNEKLIGMIEEYEGKKYLMNDDCILEKLLDKNERIGIKELDNVAILIDRDDNLPYRITLKMLWY